MWRRPDKDLTPETLADINHPAGTNPISRDDATATSVTH